MKVSTVIGRSHETPTLVRAQLFYKTYLFTYLRLSETGGTRQLDATLVETFP